MNQLVIKKKNELREKKKKGFTLVELIIVIAVIAILATVAVPKFGTVKKDANLAVDQANAKIIATAVTQAVANGDADVYGKDNKVDLTKIVAYIDGNELPIIKSESGKTFYATYSINEGTKVYVDSSKGKQLYPLDKETENNQSGNEPNSGENNTEDPGEQNK